MNTQARQPDEAQFRELVRKKWTVSLVLTAVMLAIYFGFILVLAFAKDVLAAKIGEGLSVGIPVGALVILSACALTGVYVAWANGPYDRAVKNILDSMKGE
ncbi:DUF485 domain-containing protein [Desulfovibrio aminophilus]|nr:DUF485 domain-containing protein [Desulfovibrio aminophilus]MCM0755551.1 DUF485 domain-containing protein [Desulfovibrio aminophilus]